MNVPARNIASFEELRNRTVFRMSVLVALLIFTVCSFIASLCYGAVRIPPSDIIVGLFSCSSVNGADIIWQVRLPRILTACLVGACLSVSGAILQAVMRNPLASPGIIGVSAGGGLAAMIVLIAMPYYFNLLVPAAFFGALATTVLIYLLAWENGVRPMRLILAGVAVASLLGALINALMIFFPDRVHGTVDFMVGSLSARSWKHVNAVWPYAFFGILAACLMSRRINILMLGDDVAGSLGLNIERTRMILIAISSLLAAAAVSVVGILGFVGLIVPHIMRLIIGSDHRFLIPACVIFSAGLLMGCDTLGRMIMNPVELPAGIIMAALGAPFFLYLLRGRRFWHEN